VAIQPCRWQHDRDEFKGKPPTWRQAGIRLGKPAGPKPQNLLNMPPPGSLADSAYYQLFYILSLSMG